MWSTRLLKIGAWILIACSLAHLAGHIMNSGAPPRNDAEKRLVDAMSLYVIPELGRTMQDLQDGFSLAFTVFSAGLGALALLFASSPEPALRRKAACFYSLILLVMSGIGLRYWFIAPNSFLIAALLVFSASWFASTRERNPA